MSKVLTQAQANAVYRAMCELNNVGARMANVKLNERDSRNYLFVHEDNDGKIQVRLVRDLRPVCRETHNSQCEFANTYDL